METKTLVEKYKTEHSPLPWVAYEFAGQWFVTDQKDDSGQPFVHMSTKVYHRPKPNAEFIAEACNSYYALKRKADIAMQALENIKDCDHIGASLEAEHALEEIEALTKAKTINQRGG